MSLIEEKLSLEIRIPGDPVPQPRQRHSARMVGGKIFSRNYIPNDADIIPFKALVKMSASQVYSGAPIEKRPFEVNIVAVFTRPGRLIWKSRAMPREWKFGKPDVDNIYKGVADALEGIVWTNDSQVVDLRITKIYAAGGEQPHTLIRVQEL